MTEVESAPLILWSGMKQGIGKDFESEEGEPYQQSLQLVGVLAASQDQSPTSDVAQT